MIRHNLLYSRIYLSCFSPYRLRIPAGLEAARCSWLTASFSDARGIANRPKWSSTPLPKWDQFYLFKEVDQFLYVWGVRLALREWEENDDLRFHFLDIPLSDDEFLTWIDRLLFIHHFIITVGFLRSSFVKDSQGLHLLHDSSNDGLKFIRAELNRVFLLIPPYLKQTPKMVWLVFLHWVHFLHFDEICGDIAICEVWLLQ